MLDKLYIEDHVFDHAFSSSLDNKPTFFEWVRKTDKEHIFLTDYDVSRIGEFNNPKIYAWLLESPEITPFGYEFIKNNWQKFNKIFTFDQELLQLPNSEFVPLGGNWLGIHRTCWKKSKGISIIASHKTLTDGHQLRHEAVKRLGNLIDVYGRGYNPIENKLEGLKDYEFSISIENCQKNWYFTEKIIDCFQSGTIPLYWGGDVSKFFKLKDFTFNTLQELEWLVERIYTGAIKYEDYLDDVLYNFLESRKYLIADDIIYDKVKDLI